MIQGSIARLLLAFSVPLMLVYYYRGKWMKKLNLEETK